MGELEASKTADELFGCFLHSKSDLDAEATLSELISKYVTPLIHEIVKYKLRVSSARQTLREADAAEVCSSVLIKVLERLHEWRLSSKEKQPCTILDYVAMATYHSCNQYWRDSNPKRNRTKNSLLYILSRSDEFAMWKKERDWICGLSSWKNKQTVADSTDVDRVSAKTIKKEKKSERLKAILLELNAPVRLNDLVNLMMRLEGIDSHDVETDALENIADSSRPSAEKKLEQQEFLKNLWSEILLLSEKQRTALLLSMRDEDGGSILPLLFSLRITTAKELVSAISMTKDQFGKFWSELPLDDLRIGSILGITRQQVINLRKCARERLARRIS
jgi:hypothetical protein